MGTIDFDQLSLYQLRLFCRVVEILQQDLADHGKCTFEQLARKLQKQNFPIDRLQVRRELSQIENRVKLSLQPPLEEQEVGSCGRRTQLFHIKSRKGLFGLTAVGQQLLEAAKMILEACESAPQSGPLRISISEAVSTFVLAEILSDRLHSESDQKNLPYRLEGSDHRHAGRDGKIARRELDCAITWDLRLRGYPDIDDRVIGEELPASRSPVCLIFHASHPLAHLKSANRNPDFNQLTSELSKHVILYPGNLKWLAELGAKLTVSVENCMPLEGFPSVVAHTRMGVGIGLFPKWSRVLNRLQVEDQIYTFDLPLDTPDDYKKEMWLTYYRPRIGLRAEDTDRFRDLISSRFEAWANADPDQEWKPIEWRDPFSKLTGNASTSEWTSHYINRGVGAMPIPVWRTGHCTLRILHTQGKSSRNIKAERYPKNVEGEYRMQSKKNDKVLEYSLQGTLTDKCLNLLSTPREPDRNPATISFSQVFQRGRNPGNDAENAVVFGFIQTAREGVPTVAPFILCRPEMDLSADDYRRLSTLVEFHVQARTSSRS